MGSGPSRIPAPVSALHGLQFFQELSTCSGVVSFTGYSVDMYSSVVISVGCREIPDPVLKHFPPAVSRFFSDFGVWFLTLFLPSS